MRNLLDKASQDDRAAEAVDLFCYRAKKYIGAYAAVLGGLDGLVFTGGIGERAPIIRERICDGLEFLGIRLDPHAMRNASVISRTDSRVNVRVIETNEDLMVLRHVIAVLGRTNSSETEDVMFTFDARLSTAIETPQQPEKERPPATPGRSRPICSIKSTATGVPRTISASAKSTS